MPLEHFAYLLVGLMHVVCNCREFWIMRNLHALLGVQQEFRHELTTNYAFLINLKSCDYRCAYHVILMVVIECRLSATMRFGIINGHLSLIYVKLPAV